MRSQRGFVAIEFVAAVAFLLLPIVVLVAMVPTWAERRHAATVAAREAARDLVDAWPNGDASAGAAVAERVAADHGVAGRDAVVRVSSAGDGRGSYVRVEVIVRMPAIAVMGMRVGSWRYTAVEIRRVDDFRSR
jgi:hypothetical protein